MTWVVVTRDSYEAWEAMTDPEVDSHLRIAVLNWVVGLQDGPPMGGVFAPFLEAWFAQVGNTGIWIEYQLHPDLDPPAIVIRRCR